jgi:hypothetical protein
MTNPARLSLLCAIGAIFSFTVTPGSGQPSSPYFQAVTNLHPVAYWPLQETAAPPTADVEPNLGSLGAVANAYFSSTNIIKGMSGAIVGSGDTAISLRSSQAGSFLAVPTTDPRVSLPAGGAFSVEVWVYPTNANSAAILSQTGSPGTPGLNNGPNATGWALNQIYVPTQPSSAVPAWSFHVYNGLGGTGGAEVTVTLPFLALNAWYHLVGVFDGVNASLYVNGTNAVPPFFLPAIPMTGAFVPDTWDPLTIGSGRGFNNNLFGGSLDEVAIYTSALTANQISNHYYQATSGGGDAAYVSAISGDSPLMWWRMDSVPVSAPALTAYPVAANFGSVNAGGLYLQGTTPGVAGPASVGFGATSYACAFNAVGTAATNGIALYTNGTRFATNLAVSGIMITNLDPVLNTRSNSLTFMCWFKGNPWDNNRFEGIIGHSDSSWRLAANQTGKLQMNQGGGSDVTSSRVYNDGKWHFAAAVYTNSGIPGPSGGSWGTNYLYVDGVLDGTLALTNAAATSGTNVLLGGSPDYARSGNGGYRNRLFSGSLAHVAYFSNALTAAQVQGLYSAAQPVPAILAQPASPAINYASATNTFTVTASGASTLVYQWYANSSSSYNGATALSDGGRISGSASASLVITGLQPGDAGFYFAVVTNTYGAITSTIAQLTVNADPTIIAQTPAGPFTLFVNQNYTLSVTAAGAGPFTYQWFTNGVADTSAAGTSATYALASVQLAMSGNTYRCQVTDPGGSASSTLSTLTVLSAPANGLASTILALNPDGYWPMHEMAVPATGDTETNLGTLGALGNGFYADWAGGPAPIVHRVPGALVGDSDPAVAYPQTPNGGSPGFLVIPRTSPLTTVQPPFTLEAWAQPLTSGFGDIISENGSVIGGNNQNDGVRLSWGNGGGGAATQGFQVFVGNGSARNALPGFPTTFPVGQWYHVACTYDGANWILYVNGNAVVTQPTTATYTLAVDPASPIAVGQGLWSGSGPGRAFPGAVDEVAIYASALPSAEIQAHYNYGAGLDTSKTYRQGVLDDSPVIYLRMNGPAYTPPPVSAWPVLNNYGKVGGNGVYSPSSVPGNVAGPIYGLNVMGGNGMCSFADAGADPAFNPTTVPFSYGAMFRGYPGDSRSFQAIMGHSDSSWRAAFNSTGKLQVHGAGGPDLTSSATYNDGNWHQFIVTAFPSNTVTHVPGTNILYVDGALVSSNLATSVDPGSTTFHVLLGDDPQYTNNPVGLGRALAGTVCDAAFWNNRLLSSNDVFQIWSNAGLPPYITGQPVTGRAVNGGAGTFIFFGVLANGSAPLSYRWYFNANSNYAGATLLTDGLKYTNSTTLQVTVTNLTDTDSGYYYAVLTNNYGAVTTRLATLTVYTSPILGTALPITYTNLYTLFAGSSPTFSLGSVRGAAPIYYYWLTNGVKDVAGTNATYQWHNVQPGWITNYCIVSNFVGMATSIVWTATVLPAPGTPYPQAVLGLNPLAYWRLDEPDDGLSDGNPGAIAHDYSGGNDGLYTNTSLGAAGYSSGLANQYGNAGLATDPLTTSGLFGSLSTVDGAALNIAGIDFAGASGTSRSFSIAAWVNPALTQISGAGIVTKGYGNGGEQFDLDLYQGKFRFFVRDAGGAVHGPTTAITVDGNWHHLVAVCDEPNGEVSLYVDGLLAGQSSVPATAGLLTATNLMSIGARRSGVGATSYDFQLNGNLNDVAAYNYALSAAQVASLYDAAGVKPQISQQPPATVTVSEGGTLTLTAAAIGTAPLAYQWQDAFGPVAGQTTATLVISPVPTSLSGDTFSLTVTNIYGSALSADSQITVLSGPPTIVASNLPPQVVLPLGKSYTYSIQVEGSLPFSYQWSKGGVPVSGATSSSYTVTGAALGSSTISVVVNNSHGSAGGSSLLTVVPLPSDPFGSSLLSLHPAGYWPLQENYAPAPVTMETNLGRLGSLGDAFYAMNAGPSPRITFGQSGALVNSGDNDTAVAFTGPSGTNYAFVPHYTPALTMKAPLTYEAWMISSSSAFCDMMGQGGSGVNTPIGSSTNWGGIRMSYAGNNGGGPALQAYAYNTGNNNFNSVSTPANTLPFGTWHHCVMTFDGTTCILYVDGQAQASSAALAAMVPDVSSPITIGEGRWLGDANTFGPTRSFNGTLDEVAVYTNVLTPDRVLAHYNAGTTITPSNYVAAVQADNPLLYFRMDAAGYISPDPGTYPTAVNYGSAPENGFYPGGIVPGGFPGPFIAGLGLSVAAPGNGVISCVDAGNDPAFNPTNTQPFSVMLCFKGYPSDARLQTLMSHGGNNWSLNLDGGSGKVIWNLGAGGTVTSTGILNDGTWHMVVGVSDGAAKYLYVDGVLNVSGALTAGLTGEPAAQLFLGGNADYTNVGINERYFGGALSQAALFTNALSSAQVASLFTLAVTPSISISPDGAQGRITYTGTLYSSPFAAGPYTAVPGATSPYTIPPSGTQRFFRAANHL